MKQDKITPEIILASQPNIPEAMKEYAGIKIIEAIEILIENLTKSQKEELTAKIDEVINKVL